MTSADMLRTSADLVRNRAGERREADPLAQCSGPKIQAKNSGQKLRWERAVQRVCTGASGAFFIARIGGRQIGFQLRSSDASR